MGKLFLLVFVCGLIGFIANPMLGIVLFFGGLMGVGLVALIK